jgi:hypothetical protein
MTSLRRAYKSAWLKAMKDAKPSDLKVMFECLHKYRLKPILTLDEHSHALAAKRKPWTADHFKRLMDELNHFALQVQRIGLD